MTITPVASSGIDASPPEQNAETPASGFGLLLAGARAFTGPGARSASPPSGQSTAADETSNGDVTTPAASDTSKSAPASDQPTVSTAKPEGDANVAGLLAVLAALGWAPPPLVAPASAPADGTATAAPQTPTADAAVTVGVSTDSTATAAAAIDLTAPAVTISPVDTKSKAAVDALSAGTPAPPEPTAGATTPAPTTPEPAATGPTFGPSLSSTAPAASGDPALDATTKPAIAGPGGPTSVAGSPADRARATLVSSAKTPTAATAATEAAASALTATTSASDTTAVEQVTTTSAAAPPPATEQLVSVMTPLRTTNGTYTLQLQLKPPELGRVEMRVDMKDGVLHASIHSEHEGSAQLLRDSLGDLRDRLEAANVQTGELTVSDGGVGSRDRETGDAQAQPDPVTVAGPVDPSTALIAGTTDLDTEATSLLDVRV